MLPQTTQTKPDGGAMFRAARTGAGVPLRALARRAKVGHTTLSRWERGERLIAPATYDRLTSALADYLAGKWSA